MAKVSLQIFLWIPSSYSQRRFKIKPVTLTWALSQQGPDENGLRLASFTGCGPRWGRGGRYEWLETSLGLHEEEALREDWGLQGPSAELADEGQGNFFSHPCKSRAWGCFLCELCFEVTEAVFPFISAHSDLYSCIFMLIYLMGLLVLSRNQ